MTPEKWESIPQDSGGYLSRLNIPGGWLVKYVDDVGTSQLETGTTQWHLEWRTSICFVPDPNHEWEIVKQ